MTEGIPSRPNNPLHYHIMDTYIIFKKKNQYHSLNIPKILFYNLNLAFKRACMSYIFIYILI